MNSTEMKCVLQKLRQRREATEAILISQINPMEDVSKAYAYHRGYLEGLGYFLELIEESKDVSS